MKHYKTPIEYFDKSIVPENWEITCQTQTAISRSYYDINDVKEAIKYFCSRQIFDRASFWTLDLFHTGVNWRNPKESEDQILEYWNFLFSIYLDYVSIANISLLQNWMEYKSNDHQDFDRECYLALKFVWQICQSKKSCLIQIATIGEYNSKLSNQTLETEYLKAAKERNLEKTIKIFNTLEMREIPNFYEGAFSVFENIRATENFWENFGDSQEIYRLLLFVFLINLGKFKILSEEIEENDEFRTFSDKSVIDCIKKYPVPISPPKIRDVGGFQFFIEIKLKAFPKIYLDEEICFLSDMLLEQDFSPEKFEEFYETEEIARYNYLVWIKMSLKNFWSK